MFQYISDIHLEYMKYIPYIKKSGDNIFLVGDIGHPGTYSYIKFIKYCSSVYKNVFVIYGNHEYYSIVKGSNKKIETMNKKEEYAKEFPSNVYFLNNSCVYFNQFKETVKIKLDKNDNVLDYVKIIGSTLWSNKDKKANNFKNIYVNDTELLSYEYECELYEKAVVYIINEIKNEPNIKCILLTHYSTHELCNSKYLDNKDTNNILELFEHNNLLCCINGHTHTSINTFVPGTNIQLLANCFGYKSEPQNIVNYDENAMININSINVSFNGIYGTGINYLEILHSISTRQNPIYDLGVIDLNSPFVITSHSKDNNIIYANKAFEILTEYTFEDIKNKNCRFLQSPDNTVKRGEYRKHCDNILLFNIKQHITNQEECQFITRNYKKSGQEFINIITIIPFEYNKIKYCIGFQKDITDYIMKLNFNNIFNISYTIDMYILLDIFIKQEDNINKFSKSPFFNNSPYLLYIKHKATGVINLNNTFLNKLGYSIEEINKTSLLEYVHPDDTEIRDQAIIKAINNEPVKLIARFFTKNKELVDLSWTVIPHKTYCFSIIQDITHEKLPIKPLKN